MPSKRFDVGGRAERFHVGVIIPLFTSDHGWSIVIQDSTIEATVIA
jgi:hypothetical protein